MKQTFLVIVLILVCVGAGFAGGAVYSAYGPRPAAQAAPVRGPSHPLCQDALIRRRQAEEAMTRGRDALAFGKPKGSVTPRRIPYHMSVEALRENRPRLDCRRLIVTHMGPDVLEHLAEVSEEAAYDGLAVTL